MKYFSITKVIVEIFCLRAFLNGVRPVKCLRTAVFRSRYSTDAMTTARAAVVWTVASWPLHIVHNLIIPSKATLSYIPCLSVYHQPGKILNANHGKVNSRHDITGFTSGEIIQVTVEHLYIYLFILK